MKIGITGGNGFIGWHLRCYLHSREDVSETKIATRETFCDAQTLQEFVSGLDLVVHLAGVNRADHEELTQGNIVPAEQLVQALDDVGGRPTIIYSSSTYAENTDNAYGKGKAEASKILNSWSECNNSIFINLMIPHVFGEYGRPHYNSGIATFCHQIMNGEKMSVNRTGKLELIHVQDLVEQIIDAFLNKSTGNIRVKGRETLVGDVVDQLVELKEEYITQNRIPDLSCLFTRNLFNSLRGSIPYPNRVITPKQHVDDRGWLIETIKASSTGQCFVSTTKPGITRGNHYHRRKVERFFVLQGKGRISIRKLFSDDIVNYDLDGSTPSYVDMPTLHTHNITNTGSEELITLFWADEFFDPINPDTYTENVYLAKP